MNLTFKLCTDSGCNLTITDFSRDLLDYMPDDATSAIVYLLNNRWKYRDTATVDILEYNPIDTPEIPEITNTNISYHVIEDMLMDIDENHLEIKKDGHYTVHHIVLPTKEGIARMIEDEEVSSEGDIRDIVGTLYYVDGETVYKQIVTPIKETYPISVTKQREVTNDGQTQWETYSELEYHTRMVEQVNIEEVSAIELITRNCAGTSISHDTTCFFSICKLWDCYINLCKEIFNNTNFKCSITKADTFARDFVWMSINIIKYHILFQELIEAQRILESINGCSGFCKNTGTLTKNSGCGCSK